MLGSAVMATHGSAARGHDPNYMLSLARGLEVIRALGDGKGGRSVAELSKQTGMSRAAVRRCLYTLAELGYARGSEGTFDLTPGILALGFAYIGSTALIRVGQPHLEKITNQIHESSSMAQLDRHDVVYVARAAKPADRILSIGLSVGSRLPAAPTSMGRVLLAHLDEESRNRYLTTVKLVAHTPRTIVDCAALREELARVHETGYSIVDQEFEMGLRSIAVPLRGPDQTVVAAINVYTHASRATTRVLQREFLPLLRKAASEVHAQLSHHGTPQSLRSHDDR